MTARARGGQYVVENVTLLSGGHDAFEKRYKVALTASSFQSPGNSKIAYSLLHFLLCCIDPDQAPNDFKPCFPIMDREQERDFKKVVDANLAVLERGKLIPAGVGRKSVVSAAGGEKFEQLAWMLSTVALQQAAMRHPAHATAHSLTPALPQPSAEAGRRYAGLLRSRTAAERAAFARTTQMGHDASARWAENIKEINGRIAEVEERTARLKIELVGLGFDERGVDLRKKDLERINQDRPSLPQAAGGKVDAAPAAGVMPDRVVTPMPVPANACMAPASPALATDGASELYSVTMGTSITSDPASVTSSELQMSADQELLDKLHHVLDFGKGEASENGAAAERVLERIAIDKNGIPVQNVPTKPAEKTGSPDEFFDFPPELKPCADIAELVRAAAKELDNGAKRIKIISQQKKMPNSAATVRDKEAALLSVLTQEVQKSLSYYKNISESTSTLTARASGAARAAAKTTAEAQETCGEDRSGEGAETHDMEMLLLKTICLPEDDDEPDWAVDAELLNAHPVVEESNPRDSLRESVADQESELERGESNADSLAAEHALHLEKSFLSTMDDLRHANGLMQIAAGSKPPDANTTPPSILLSPVQHQREITQSETTAAASTFASQRAASLAQRLAAARAGSAPSVKIGVTASSAAAGSSGDMGECDKLSITSYSEAKNESAVSPQEALSVSSLVHSTQPPSSRTSDATSESSLSWNRRQTSSLVPNRPSEGSLSFSSTLERKSADVEKGKEEVEAGETEKSGTAADKQSRIKSLRARLTALR